ncbi:MAG: hypothetical protein IKU07_03805 [Oscillospiraceae bacterium]|nr:hypothetical protein [Oscillospiraceae bacterium]
MILYAIILLLSALLCGVLAVRIYQGKTELIHDYHQKNVKDLEGYGKAFGKALGFMAAAMAVSGLLAFAVVPAVIVLVAGLTVGILMLVAVQKKYNGGVF